MSKMIIRSLQARKKKIAKAIAGLECESCKITAAIAALMGNGEPGKATKSAGKRRKMSAAARKKIGAAQKARWAKFHAEKK